MAKGNIVVEAASEYLFEHEGDHGDEENPIVFKDLSQDEKLALVIAHQKRVIVDLANTWKSNQAQRAARANEADKKHTV